MGCEANEVADGLVCPDCLDRLNRVPQADAGVPGISGIVHVRNLGHYTPPHSSLVHELKYRNRRSIAQYLGVSLARLVLSDAMLKNADMLIPVPLHPARLRERGYNQSQLLAEQVSRLVRIPWADALRRVRNTRPQVTLDDKAREKEVKGAFAARPETSVRGKKVVLVDDVSTTGATLASAAQALSEAGALQIYALVVARRSAVKGR